MTYKCRILLIVIQSVRIYDRRPTSKDTQESILMFPAFSSKTLYFMNKTNLPNDNLANDAVWQTVVFKVSAFYYCFFKNWLK